MISVNEWNAFSLKEQREQAKKLALELPGSFHFAHLVKHSLGGVERRVAFFQRDEDMSTFALTPSCRAQLGFDAAKWEPTEDEQDSWRDTAEEYEISDSLEQYVQQATTSLRTVEIPTMLVETAPTEVGWEPIGFDDPDVQELLENKPRGKRPFQGTLSRKNRDVRLTRDDRGDMKAEVAHELKHRKLKATLKKQGFRYPTCDEWEYLCGAGAPSLFRWGDHAPCDRYPTDRSPEEAAWRREWVLSGGKLPFPKRGFESDWDYHLRPNALGLLIAQDPYKSELVAESNTTRGGDGGSVVCGGVGFFVGWLTLATAYFEKHACKVDRDLGLTAGYTIGRRVLTID